MLWPTCQDGSWSLWALERAGIDCSEMGFTCAERARQSALRALPPSPERDTLAACAPIVDRETLLTAGRAEAEAAVAEAAGGGRRAAAWAAAAAGCAAVAAGWVEAGWVEAAELAVIAELVRGRWPVPPQEVNEMLGGEG